MDEDMTINVEKDEARKHVHLSEKWGLMMDIDSLYIVQVLKSSLDTTKFMRVDDFDESCFVDG